MLQKKSCTAVEVTMAKHTAIGLKGECEIGKEHLDCLRFSCAVRSFIKVVRRDER